MNRETIIFIILASVVVAVAGIFFFGRRENPAPVTLGLWSIESEDVWNPIITEYKKLRPEVTVNYSKIDEGRYEETLINKLAEGRGPDMFTLPHTLIQKHAEKIFPLPREFNVTSKKFEETFVDLAKDSLITSEGEIIGIPLFVDTLALFYNQDIFDAEGIAEPPKHWDEVEAISRKLTKTTSAGDIQRSGIALGTFANITNAYEILSALIMQYGDRLHVRGAESASVGARTTQALRFYTLFADQQRQQYSWNKNIKNSDSALADRTTVMTLGFAGDIDRIRAKNPNLSLKIAGFPQFKGTENPLTYGKLNFLTVSRSSRSPFPTWEFALYLASQDGARQFLEKTGLPPARRSFVAEGQSKGDLETFYRQALIATSWIPPNEESVRRLFRDIVDSINRKSATPEEATEVLKEQLELLLR